VRIGRSTFDGRDRALRRNAAFMRQQTRAIYVLPDKSGVPAETIRLDFLQYQGAPAFDLSAKSPNNSAKDVWRFGRRIY
jgi:hypothetical protein